MRYLVTFFLVTFYSFGFDYHLEPYSVTDGISCMFGLHGKATKSNGGRVVNTCYIETSKGYVVIDSGPTYSYAQQAYSAMQKRKPLPVKYVINTSAQEVNILGSGFYKNMGAKIISPTSYKSMLKHKKLQIATKISADAFSKSKLVASNGYINRYKKLSIGGVDIIIRNLEKGSSRNLIVSVPKFKTLFAGNYIYNQTKLSLGEHKSFLSWNRAIKKIESMKWNYIISSHGTKIKRNALNSTKSYLKHNLKLILRKNRTDKTEIKRINKVKSIHYTHNFLQAKREAIREHKLVMIKIEANHCQPCEKLNRVLETNNRIKRLVNHNIKVVKVNTDNQERVPMGLSYMGTPTVFLIQPKTQKVLMRLQGVIQPKELEESLKIFVNDILADNQQCSLEEKC
ncbi:MAG TPA: MBL fold metallo-hydrolase [Campylobacterales bacterium]|nr:MBL fold metallo-hydrolase [Campylobacterales bacterium]